MNTRHRVVAAAIATACIAFAAASWAAPPEDGAALTARLDGIENVQNPYPWLVTGGLPDAQALERLAGLGAWDVIDMTAPDPERGFDEHAKVEALGMRYLPIPTTKDDFTDARFTAFRHHLIAHGPEHPLFVHCASGNRVGAALLPWLVLDRGMEDDEALALARTIGLRDSVLTARAWTYIRSHEPEPQAAR